MRPHRGKAKPHFFKQKITINAISCIKLLTKLLSHSRSWQALAVKNPPSMRQRNQNFYVFHASSAVLWVPFLGQKIKFREQFWVTAQRNRILGCDVRKIARNGTKFARVFYSWLKFRVSATILGKRFEWVVNIGGGCSSQNS